MGKNQARERVSGDVFLPHHRQNYYEEEFKDLYVQDYV
jgi:hypothetical protein